MVELLVGSTRQCRILDKLQGNQHKTGLCFERYADLAEKNHWQYNRLLLADFEDEKGQLRKPALKPGTAMGELKKDSVGKYKHVDDQFLAIQGPEDRSKTRILTYQHNHIVKKYPNDRIRFVFLDDRLDIIKPLIWHFQSAHEVDPHPEIEHRFFHFNTALLFSRQKFSNADNATVIEEAKKLINLVEVLKPASTQHIASTSQDYKSVLKINTLRLFSVCSQHRKETSTPALIHCDTVNYWFILKAFSLLAACLVTLSTLYLLDSMEQSDSEPSWHALRGSVTPSF